MQPDKKTMARLKPGCICHGIKLIRLLEAIEQGADSFAAVAEISGIGNGDCNGKRCRAKVEMLLSENPAQQGEHSP